MFFIQQQKKNLKFLKMYLGEALEVFEGPPVPPSLRHYTLT